MADPTPRTPGWTRSLAVYLQPRVLAILFLGFSSGLPLLLTASTLAAWLTEANVSLAAIGAFALVGIPYSLKFLWAPLVDHLPIPWLDRRLGRRRSWALVTQAALMAAIVGLGLSQPASTPGLTAFFAVLIAFCSATQDIVIDAFRVELLEERQQGAGAAMVVLGYRLGMLFAGAGSLMLASVISWPVVYMLMAVAIAVGSVTVLLCPEPIERRPPRGGEQGVRGWIERALIAPFADFIKKPAWLWILAFIALYKVGDALAGVMAMPFYLDIGFSKPEIAGVSKVFGLVATIIGGLVGGVLVSRMSVIPSLLVCGVLQMVSNLMFVFLAWAGHDLGALTLTIAVENVASGMGTAAFVAFLSGLCSVQHTATQYALLSSLSSVGRTVLASPGGWLAQQISWMGFFAFTTVAALPGLVLLLYLMRRLRRGGPDGDAPALA